MKKLIETIIANDALWIPLAVVAGCIALFVIVTVGVVALPFLGWLSETASCDWFPSDNFCQEEAENG